MGIETFVAGPLPGLDPNECEREPIHIPGAIQPHGALLAALAESGIVTHASANLAAILGYSTDAVLGKPIEFAIGKAAWHVLQTSKPGERIMFGTRFSKIGPDARDVSLNAYWTGHYIGIDLEPADSSQAQNLAQTPAQTPLLFAVQSIIETFERATTKLELCHSAMQGLKALTGYDRVMVYRFGEQGHGEVMAEAHAPHLDPYLGNNYPTTDIPPQARRLFLAKRVSSVVDSSYEPVPLLMHPRSDHGMPLDLTQSALRSVSPIHREYMRNMGTVASLSIGLAAGSELWGFIICHHGTPRIAGPDLRAAVDMIGRVVSALLGSLDEAEIFAQRNAQIDTMRSLVERLAGPTTPAAALATAKAELLRLVDAEGALVCIAGEKLPVGNTPPAVATKRATLVMQSRAAGALLAVDNFGLAYPNLASCTDAGSGALLLPLSDNGEDFILWFRPEHSRIVTWAGDPSQHGTRDTITGQLSPRASFAAWKQITAGRSRPWTKADLALASELGNAVKQELARRAIAELVLLRHYQDLHDSLELKVEQRTEALKSETSERLKAEATLQQVQKMEAIGQLTGGVAHDFNNLLAAVLGNLELASINTSDPTLLRLLENAQHAAERGAKLTDHLLSFARKLPLNKEACDINQLVSRFHGLITRTIGSSVLIKLELAAHTHLVMADPVQFEMALLNIAVNARDAMVHGGRLVFSTVNVTAPSPGVPLDLEAGDYVCITAQDNGTGIPEDVAKRVFEPFFTTKGVGKGTGLGLSQVYGFCKQLGGTASISSKPGAGTYVSMFLPRITDLASVLPLPQQSLAVTPAKLRVLVVDDDPDVLSMVAEMLEMLRFDVITADGGVRGVDILTSSLQVDLVVTDFSMPLMNGIEFIRHARQLQPGLPCLMMTGYADVGNFAEAAADDIPIMRKPYKMKELAAIIQLAQHSTEQSSRPPSLH